MIKKIFMILALSLCVDMYVLHARNSNKTNIILIFVDDLGMGDLACFGNSWIPTPHIDSLARDGVKMEMSYVTNPPCSPSRSALMTGMYAQKFGKFGMARGFGTP